MVILEWLDQIDMALEPLKKYGVNNVSEAMAFKSEMEAIVNQINESIKMTKNLHDSAKYDYLTYLNEYNNYEAYTITSEEMEDLKNYKLGYTGGKWREDTGNMIVEYDYNGYHEAHPDVTPIEFIEMVSKSNPNSEFKCRGIDNESDLKDLLLTKESAPNMIKTYEYYYNQDPKKAKEYFDAVRYEINNIKGQVEAKEFLDSLGEIDGDDETLEVIYNELGVHGQGLADGLDTFGWGIYHAGEAGYTGIQTLLKEVGLYDGEVYENRIMNSSEYKKMYILQALLSKEDKEKLGLVNEDGSNANPNSIIDFSKEYSGAFLNNNYEISQGIGNMLPSIAISAVNPAAGSVVMGVSAGGNAYHGAMVDGKSYLVALGYGIFTGTSEAITERFLGGLPGLSNVQVDGLRAYLQSMGKEGTQEIIQGLMDEIYQSAFMGKELPTTKEQWAELAANLGKQGLYGAITAGYLNVPSLAGSSISLKSFDDYLSQNNITVEEQQLALEQIRQLDAKYANLSDSEIKLQYTNELIEQLNINKLVSMGIHDDVAKVMLENSVNEEVATYMVENNVNVEEAQIALKQIPVEPRKDYFEDIDLSKYEETQCVYTLDQILKYSYPDVCNVFFDIAPSDESRLVLEEILLRGEYDGFKFASDLPHKDNPSIESDRRIAMANLYLRNPETFEFICQNKIDLFHGTNGTALESILNNGLCSLAESSQNDIEVTTGEEWSRTYTGNRSFVSFADVLDIAKEYSNINPSDAVEEYDFPIIIGTTTEAADRTGVIPISSDVSEVGVRGKLDVSDIKAIFVPSDKVELVKQMIGDSDIEVLALDQDGQTDSNLCDIGLHTSEDKIAAMKEELKTRYESQFSEEVRNIANANGLSFEVAELMLNNSNMSLEQAQAIDQIHKNDPTMDINHILPETAEDVLALQEIAMSEGMTLKEYGSQKSEETVGADLQAMADTLAAQKRAEAEAAEPKISSDMKALENAGRHLSGFDYRLKGEESISRKLILDYNNMSKKNPDFTLQDAYDRIGDSVRFTMICDETSYTNDVKSCLQELQEKGYELSYLRNTFDNPMYKGVNVGLVSPDGVKTEIQFHTEQSFLYKDDIGHLYYEIARNEFVSPEAKEIANRIRKEIASQVILPEGVLELSKDSVLINNTNDSNIEMKSFDPTKLDTFDDTKYTEFCSEVDKVINSTQEQLPDGVDSVDEYKKSFVNSLIETGQIDTMHNQFIAKICEDPVMFRELVDKTERVEYLLEKNYLTKHAKKLNETIFSNLSLEDVSKLLDKPRMKEFLKSQDPSDVGKFIGSLNSALGDGINSHDLITDIICNYDVKELKKLSSGYLSTSPLMMKLFNKDYSNQLSIDNVVKIINHIESLYTEENLSELDFLESGISSNILPSGIWDIEDQKVIDALTKLLGKKKYYTDKFINLLEDSSEIELTNPLFGDGLLIPVGEGVKYLDIEVEIDGVSKKYIEKVYGNSFYLDSFVKGKEELLNALLDGKLKIKNAEENPLLSKMILGKDDGIQEGVNYITYRENGEIKTKIATTNTVTIDGEDDFIYLKHGQTVYIGYDGENDQLPVGLKYS